MARNHVTVDALGFFGEPFDEGSGVDDFALGFGQRLALLGGHQAGQVILVLDHQLEPAAQLVGALLGGQRTPGRQGLFGSLDGTTGFCCAHLRHAADDLAGRRVVHLDGLAAVGIHPGAVDIGLLTEQLGIFELHKPVSFEECHEQRVYLDFPVCLVVWVRRALGPTAISHRPPGFESGTRPYVSPRDDH
ncbi:hypothetical protein D3C81_1480220 [compost metagenome]